MALTSNERQQKVIRFSFCVTRLGFTQKEAAAIVGISERVACKWVKEYNLRSKIVKLQNQKRESPIKFDESLTAFRVFVKIRNPSLHSLLEAEYAEFLKTT